MLTAFYTMAILKAKAGIGEKDIIEYSDIHSQLR
jgi:hypothetical protein